MATKIKKIFVGGIPLALSETTFREHFEKYGEITDVQIVKDRATGDVVNFLGLIFVGRSRGFGFVRFQDPSSVKKVMKEKHYLGSKLVEVKKAEPKNALLMASEAQMESKLSEASWTNSTRTPTTASPIVVGNAPLGVIPLVPGLVIPPRGASGSDSGSSPDSASEPGIASTTTTTASSLHIYTFFFHVSTLFILHFSF